MIPALAGGIGVFLLGMVLLTDGLKSLAGGALRSILARFTRGPVSSMASGALVTVLAQSSTITTLATIGFVNSGLLNFTQAVGVILGANLGTTATGWMVLYLGLKFSIVNAAMLMVGAGALMRLLGRGRLASGGLALAGFGLIFVGIDMLQTGMKHLGNDFDLSGYEAATIWGRALLVGTGVLMTVVMQSSSAAVATTLTALHTGAIQLDQAAALVIGQNIGTTVKAALAAIGSSTAARRTALAHILFNLLTGTVALLVFPLFMHLNRLIAGEILHESGAMVLALFHTSFNVLGILLIFPFLGPFARVIVRLLPERGPALTRRLDDSVTVVPALAVEASCHTIMDTAAEASRLVRERVRGTQLPVLQEEIHAAMQAVDDTRSFIGRAQMHDHEGGLYARFLSQLHALDHLGRLLGAVQEPQPAGIIDSVAPLGDVRDRLAAGLAGLEAWLGGLDSTFNAVEPLRALSTELAEIRRTRRAQILEHTARGRMSPLDADEQLKVMQWLDRLTYHVWRMSHHLAGNDTTAQPGGPLPAE